MCLGPIHYDVSIYLELLEVYVYDHVVILFSVFKIINYYGLFYLLHFSFSTTSRTMRTLCSRLDCKNGYVI